MENFDWISFFFYSAIGWIVAKIIAIYLDAKNQQLAKDIQVLRDRIDSRIIDVKIEQHGEMFYLFDKRNDSFVAQGKTLAEVTQHVDDRFKGSKVILANTEDLTAAGLK